MADPTRLRTGALLDTWSSHVWKDGVQIESVEDRSRIRVRTQNSVYEITVLDVWSRKILIRGGQYFPEDTPVYLAGSTLGGSLLKVGGIFVGFCLEATDDEGRRVVTSPVQSVHVYPG